MESMQHSVHRPEEYYSPENTLQVWAGARTKKEAFNGDFNGCAQFLVQVFSSKRCSPNKYSPGIIAGACLYIRDNLHAAGRSDLLIDDPLAAVPPEYVSKRLFLNISSVILSINPANPTYFMKTGKGAGTTNRTQNHLAEEEIGRVLFNQSDVLKPETSSTQPLTATLMFLRKVRFFCFRAASVYNHSAADSCAIESVFDVKPRIVTNTIALGLSRQIEVSDDSSAPRSVNEKLPYHSSNRSVVPKPGAKPKGKAKPKKGKGKGKGKHQHDEQDEDECGDKAIDYECDSSVDSRSVAQGQLADCWPSLDPSPEPSNPFAADLFIAMQPIEQLMSQPMDDNFWQLMEDPLFHSLAVCDSLR